MVSGSLSLYDDMTVVIPSCNTYTAHIITSTSVFNSTCKSEVDLWKRMLPLYYFIQLTFVFHDQHIVY